MPKTLLHVGPITIFHPPAFAWWMVNHRANFFFLMASALIRGKCILFFKIKIVIPKFIKWDGEELSSGIRIIRIGLTFRWWSLSMIAIIAWRVPEMIISSFHVNIIWYNWQRKCYISEWSILNKTNGIEMSNYRGIVEILCLLTEKVTLS